MTAAILPTSPQPLKLWASISRLHIVAIAALGTFTFGWLFTGTHLWLLSSVCALDWFLVNLLNRVVDLPEDRANHIAGTDFVARHRRGILVGGLLALFGSLALVHLVAPQVTLWRVGYHALGLAYNWPLLPGGRRIKQLYFWKNTASATGFMITVFGYPLVVGAGERPPGITAATVGCAALFFFLFEISYEVIYDLRDAPGDRAADVRTYPVVHGERGAVRIIDTLIGAAVTTLVVGYALGILPWRIFVMVLAPAIQLAAYKRALRRGITSRDCILLTWTGAGLLLAYHLWIAAGLPGVGW
ncbi:MAG: UbiA family prenyltransferase [Myxococcota bacterium]